METVAEFMTSGEIVTVEPGTHIIEAAELMRERRIHHLVVVDDHGAMAGVISSWDLLAALAQHVKVLTSAAVEPHAPDASDDALDGCER